MGVTENSNSCFAMAISSRFTSLRLVSSRTHPIISSFSSRQFHPSLASNMPINVGDKIPSVDLFEDSPANKVNTSELTTGKKRLSLEFPVLLLQDVQRLICLGMWLTSTN